MLHMPQGLPNQTVMGASGAYARKTHTTMCHLKQQTHLMQNIKSANMFQTHTSGQCFTLLVNPSHFWSITSGRSFPCHACNFWSILHTSNQSVTLLPVTSGQSLTLLGSILHRSIRVKMQSESSTVYWRSKRSHGINLELVAHERLIPGTQERRTDTTLINQKVEIYGHSLIIAKRSRGEFNATSMN